EGELRLEADRVARAGHRVVLEGADQQVAERVERAFAAGGLEPPDPDRLAPIARGSDLQKILALLIARGDLVRIHDGKLFHAAALRELIRRLAEYGRQSPTIDVAAFKTLAGVTRKHAIPLLEHLDATRVTRRVGDRREILVREGSG
ncbi:MAG TPA: SelB C-terminal domain-containing protein, partial [Candidatus Polarisedimenticolaceae bacterium]|nr:SelB C-terminal domain-containing protein [Candidatus Polarisedimenticolaceae bacterium]